MKLILILFFFLFYSIFSAWGENSLPINGVQKNQNQTIQFKTFKENPTVRSSNNFDSKNFHIKVGAAKKLDSNAMKSSITTVKPTNSVQSKTAIQKHSFKLGSVEMKGITKSPPKTDQVIKIEPLYSIPKRTPVDKTESVVSFHASDIAKITSRGKPKIEVVQQKKIQLSNIHKPNYGVTAKPVETRAMGQNQRGEVHRISDEIQIKKMINHTVVVTPKAVVKLNGGEWEINKLKNRIQIESVKTIKPSDKKREISAEIKTLPGKNLQTYAAVYGKQGPVMRTDQIDPIQRSFKNRIELSETLEAWKIGDSGNGSNQPGTIKVIKILERPR